MHLASVTCQHTGISRPECSCRHCLTDLMNRFAPPPYGQAGVSQLAPTAERADLEVPQAA